MENYILWFNAAVVLKEGVDYTMFLINFLDNLGCSGRSTLRSESDGTKLIITFDQGGQASADWRQYMEEMLEKNCKSWDVNVQIESGSFVRFTRK